MVSTETQAWNAEAADGRALFRTELMRNGIYAGTIGSVLLVGSGRTRFELRMRRGASPSWLAFKFVLTAHGKKISVSQPEYTGCFAVAEHATMGLAKWVSDTNDTLSLGTGNQISVIDVPNPATRSDGTSEDRCGFSSAYWTSTYVTVSVSSSPSPADVWLDGGYQGTTDATFRVLAGTKQVDVVVRRDGFVDFASRIPIKGKDVIRVNATLQPVPKAATSARPARGGLRKVPGH